MKKLFTFCISLFLISACFANMNPGSMVEPKLNVNNIVLTKINGKNISVIDVMKKMDFVFHKAYPNLITSKQARYQFYTSSWTYVLKELINTELMIAQAEVKEVKISDSEIRETMEERYGPNTLIILEDIGLSYDEAFQMIKTEMIVQRMMWYFVHSKALTQVTPQLIRQEYRLHLEKNPPYDEWDYQVISIKGTDDLEAEIVANKTHEIVKNTTLPLDDLADQFKDFEKEFTNTKIQISNTYKVTSKDVSKAHKDVLTTLEEDSYSAPNCQTSRFDNKKIHRIFYMKRHELKKPPTFEEMADNIKHELLNKIVTDESNAYFSKLRKYYGVIEEETIIPDNFVPFSLE